MFFFFADSGFFQIYNITLKKRLRDLDFKAKANPREPVEIQGPPSSHRLVVGLSQRSEQQHS